MPSSQLKCYKCGTPFKNQLTKAIGITFNYAQKLGGGRPMQLLTDEWQGRCPHCGRYYVYYPNGKKRPK